MIHGTPEQRAEVARYLLFWRWLERERRHRKEEPSETEKRAMIQKYNPEPKA